MVYWLRFKFRGDLLSKGHAQVLLGRSPLIDQACSIIQENSFGVKFYRPSSNRCSKNVRKHRRLPPLFPLADLGPLHRDGKPRCYGEPGVSLISLMGLVFSIGPCTWNAYSVAMEYYVHSELLPQRFNDTCPRGRSPLI